MAKQTLLHECAFGSILVLGDSRVEAAVVPAGLPLPAANISFGGSTPVETYFFARVAMKCRNPPRLVIYAHSMPSFIRPTQFLWKNAARYGYIGFAGLRAVAGTAARVHDPMLAETSTHDGLTGIVRDVVYGAGFPTIYTASLIDGRGVGRHAYNEALLERTVATRGQVVYEPTGTKTLVGIDADEPNFVSSPLEATYFEKTLALFATAHIPVLLLTIPASQSTVRAVSGATRVRFAGFLRDAAERYPNVMLGTPGLLGWPDAFYIDGSHMDKAGAAAFTSRLATCVRQWLDQPNRSQPCDFAWK